MDNVYVDINNMDEFSRALKHFEESLGILAHRTEKATRELEGAMYHCERYADVYELVSREIKKIYNETAQIQKICRDIGERRDCIELFDSASSASFGGYDEI